MPEEEVQSYLGSLQHVTGLLQAVLLGDQHLGQDEGHRPPQTPKSGEQNDWGGQMGIGQLEQGVECHNQQTCTNRVSTSASLWSQQSSLPDT